MAAVNIWVEGVADQKFLSDLIKKWFSLHFDKKFECKDDSDNVLVRLRNGGGVNSFTTKARWELNQPNFEGNDQNLIVIDADEDFEKRKEEVVRTITGVNFSPENHLFLIPNHHNAGNLETLLEQIINPEHKILFKCWNAYEACLQSNGTREYTLPPRKAKIYAYLEALLSEKEKIKEPERDYTNPEHWNLDHTKEPLKPLYEFLKKHLMP